jgi:fumarate reductase subunit C
MTYPRQTSNTWYLKRWPYRIFMLREFSAVFLAFYMVLMLVVVMKVHNGRGSFEQFADTLKSPWLIAVNTIALLFALLHTVTWFQAVPSAVQLRRGEERVPPRLLIGAAYAVLLGVTAIVLIVVLV